MNHILVPEAENKVLNSTITETAADTPDIYSDITKLNAKKVKRLAKAMHRREERNDAVAAFHELIGRSP